MSCAETKRVDDYFAGGLRSEAERRLREHLPECQECSTRYARHTLLERLRPERSSAKERLARSLGLRSQRRSWFAQPGAQLAFVGAALTLLVLFFHTGRDPGFRARSGGMGAVSQTIELLRVPTQGTPELVRGEIRASDELGVRYRNPSGKRYLMVFARDAHDHFYWYFPAWTDPALDPVAVSIERGAELHELGEVVGHDFDTDAIQVTALFTDTPLSVRAVEAQARAMARDRFAVSGAEVLTMTLRVRR